MSILEKKIQQLESQLTTLLLAPPSSDMERSWEDFPAKFGFLKNLLDMEVNSQKNREHSDHVASRLATLEAAFDRWMEHGGVPTGDLLEATPACSCTHSCLIDDEEGEADGNISEFASSANLGRFVDSMEDGIIDKVEEACEKEDSKNSVSNNNVKSNVAEKNEDGNGARRRTGNKCCLLAQMVVFAAAAFMAVARELLIAEDNDFFVPT